jgi:hypothetical protein
VEEEKSVVRGGQEEKERRVPAKLELKQEVNIFGVLSNVIDLDDDEEFQKYL